MPSIDDIEGRWRPLTDAQTLVAPQLLDDAAALVAAKFPTLAAALTDETVDSTLYTAVIVAMVVRVLRNPDNMKTETAGDWSGEPYDRGALYLADDEADLISEALGLGSTSAFTISPYYTSDSVTTIEL